MRTSIFIGLLFLLNPLLQNTDEAEVLRSVHVFIQAINTGDAVLLGSVLDKNGTSRYWDVEAQKAGEVIHREYLDGLSAGSGDREEILEALARVKGKTATVWAKYVFYKKDALSHCGSEVFSLEKKNSKWLIVSIDYTIERSNCPEEK